MKDIAKAAGVGDATIYNYFPSKERLILGYFDWLAEQAVRSAQATPDFSRYDLQSKLQRLTDALLEAMAPDRVFVGLARDLLAKSPLLLLGDQLKARVVLKDTVAGYLEGAVSSGEMPPSDYLRAMGGLYVDFCYGVIAFWLHDTTEHAAETTRLVDQLLGVTVTMLKAGLPDRLVQLAGYLLRSQLARVMDMARVVRPAAREDPGPQSTPKGKPLSRRSKPRP